MIMPLNSFYLTVYKWSLNGTLRDQLLIPKYLWGLVAVCAIDLLFACTLSFVRNRMYTLFFMVHVTSVIVFLSAVGPFLKICFRTLIASRRTYTPLPLCPTY
jgi:ferric-chelate reductase